MLGIADTEGDSEGIELGAPDLPLFEVVDLSLLLLLEVVFVVPLGSLLVVLFPVLLFVVFLVLEHLVPLLFFDFSVVFSVDFDFAVGLLFLEFDSWSKPDNTWLLSVEKLERFGKVSILLSLLPFSRRRRLVRLSEKLSSFFSIGSLIGLPVFCSVRGIRSNPLH